MKKLVSLFLLLFIVISLASCGGEIGLVDNPNINPTILAFARYSDSIDCQTVSVCSTIYQGSEEVAQELRLYTLGSSSVEIQERVLAPIESEEEITITNKTESYTGTPFIYAIQLTDFDIEDLVNLETNFSGTIKTDSLSKLGLDSTKVNGKVSFTLTLEDSFVKSTTITYTSTTANTVEIITVFNK